MQTNRTRPDRAPGNLTSTRSRLWRNCLMTSAVALAAWIPCEILGGLLFLSLGFRLWTYHIAPLCWELTSLAGWALLFPVLGSQFCLYLAWERRVRLAGLRRWLWRAGFLMVSGPANEVFWNTLIWSASGGPLYLYTVLPTFGGSGSFLSPLYYVTLLAGFWLDERVPGTLSYHSPALSSLEARDGALDYCSAGLTLTDSTQQGFVDAEVS